MIAAEVFRQKFWMALFGGEYPKPSCLWSNSPTVRKFNLGRLTKDKKPVKKVDPTAVKYVDSKGKVRYKGVKKALKNSQ